MTDVPEHLLQRSRERREALGLAPKGEGGEGAPAEAAAAPPATTEAAAPAPSAPAAPAAPPAEIPEGTPPPTGPPQPARPKERVPMWAMPVLVALPFWALVYGGAFGEREAHDANDPVAIGATVYVQAGCGGCHGPSGEGGVGPALGAVEETFPNFADHVQWVVTGSQALAGQPYGARGQIATGGMPGFEGSLTEEEILAVSCYERVQFGGTEPPEECTAPAEGAEGEAAGEEDTDGAGESGDEEHQEGSTETDQPSEPGR